MHGPSALGRLSRPLLSLLCRHLAEWRKTPIALKTSHYNIPAFEKLLFMRELDTMTRMRHTNVVQVCAPLACCQLVRTRRYSARPREPHRAVRSRRSY